MTELAGHLLALLAYTGLAVLLALAVLRSVCWLRSVRRRSAQPGKLHLRLLMRAFWASLVICVGSAVVLIVVDPLVLGIDGRLGGIGLEDHCLVVWSPHAGPGQGLIRQEFNDSDDHLPAYGRSQRRIEIPLPETTGVAFGFGGLCLGLLWWLSRGGSPGRACQGCGYDLTGNISGVCPECGQPRR